jgi:VWFA-related protein
MLRIANIISPSCVRVLTVVLCAGLLAAALAFLPARTALAHPSPLIASSEQNVAQEQAGTAGGVSTSSATGNEVTVFATVRDKKGKLAADLNQSDFTLTEDGHPQSIQHFTKAENPPLTLGLLVDTSPGQALVLDEIRNASRSFIDQEVREGTDKAFIIHFDHEVELLQDLTSSHQKLEKALSSLQVAQFSTEDNSQDQDSGRGPGGPGGGRHFHRRGAQLYDAVYLACHELMKKASGRKVLIILSDGVDRDSKETLDFALETAQRTDTTIYSVHVKGEEGWEGGNRGGFGGPGVGGGGMGRHGGGGRGYPPPEDRPDGKKTLTRISNETGGRFAEASKKLPVEEIYSQIAEELRSQYDLSFTPVPAQAMASGYHKIQLTVDKKDFAVQARNGYYSPAVP